jgi:carbon monoxide dehydrogenase subunit G
VRISGRATIDAPPEAVFAAICDPGTLLAVIPGCEELRRTAADEYRGQIVLRLPALGGRYDTEVRLVDAEPPLGGTLAGLVTGRAGSVVGHATFRLVPNGSGSGTSVEYDGEGTLAGPLARLDSRFVEGLVETLVGEGLARLGQRLRTEPVVAPSVALSVAPSEPAGRGR